MKNDVIRAIESRRTSRAYTDELIPKEEVDLLCKAALHAPSAMNLQLLRIIALSNKGLLKELERDIVAQYKKSEPEIYERIAGRNELIFYNAPLVIFIAMEKMWNGDVKQFPNSILDAGIAVQNIALAATSMKLGSVILGLPRVAFLEDDIGAKWKEKLRFEQGFEFAIAIAVGKSSDTKEPHELDFNKVIKIY